MNELKIYDIKPLFSQAEYSFLFWTGIFISILILCGIVYLIYKLLKKRKSTKRKEYFQILQNLNFQDTKKTAYDITKYGNLLAKTPVEIQLLNDLTTELETYKYKKDVPQISNETKVSFGNFVLIL